MEAAALLRRKQKRSKRRYISIAVGVTIVIILVTLIPLTLRYSRQPQTPRQRQSQGFPSFVLVPVYGYPVTGAWDPLFNAVRVRTDVNFTIVVNPRIGPGPATYPERAYADAVQNLNAYQNVRTVGYVRTGWTTRNISSVLAEVETYSGWVSYGNDGAIAMHGIFFDETPTEYSADAFDYLKTINQAAKNASGLLSDRLVIHNPGTLVDARLNLASTDITVIFEKSYETFQKERLALASSSFPRSQSCYMINSVPAMSFDKLGDFVDAISEHAAALFVTDSTEDYYKGFGSQWMDFIEVIPV